MGKYTLIDLVQIILYITYTIDTIYAYKNYSKCPINSKHNVTCSSSKVVGFLRITRFNTIYRGFYKTCELTVLLESFDLFTDLALQVPGFCLQ